MDKEDRRPRSERVAIHRDLIQPFTRDKNNSKNVGDAGEALVSGYLRLFGFSTGKMAPDDGVDLMALRNDKVFKIQVKTANENINIGSESSQFTCNISQIYYDKHHGPNTYYVFVLIRENKHGSTLIDCLVISSMQLLQFREDGLICRRGGGKTITVTVNEYKEGFLMNSMIDAGPYTNAFNTIV